MANLQKLQDALRNDPAVRAAFTQDPASVLAQHGIVLDAAQLGALQAQLQAAGIAGAASPQAISVGITVGG